MKQLLKELVENGSLEAFQGDELQLPFLLTGIVLVRKGALCAGAGILGSVRTWGKPEIELLRNIVEPNTLLNVVAEDFHGSFGQCKSHGPVGLAWGAILGDFAGRIGKFYEKAPKFITRVVGVGYEDRLDRIDSLVPGQPVSLVWDPLNPHDSKAIKVLDSNGEGLGYLRKNIAHSLVPRIKKGAAMCAKVAVVLGEEFNANSRLNIEVNVWDDIHARDLAMAKETETTERSE